MSPSPTDLLAEAARIPFRGWDFSVLGDRLVLEPPSWSFERTVDGEAERAGSMLDLGTGAVFADIGALAWYLLNVPWAVPGFDIETHRDALLRLHGRPVRVPAPRFWLRARSPG